jgi:hypothetical protein
LTNSPSGAQLIADRRSFASYRGDEWNAFAAATGESFLGSWGVVKARRFFGHVRLFDFILLDGAGSRKKVGQCAVHARRRIVTFLDKIQLLPGQRHLNRKCFDLVAAQFGDVAYKYGSRWNDEEEFNLEGLPRFDVDRKTFHIDVIQFCEWPNFAAYRRAVSENIRRDYKKAKEANAIARTEYGLAGLRELVAFVEMRRHMALRNKLPFSRVVDFFTHAGRLFALGKDSFVTTVRIDGKCYAAFFGAVVGSRLYYLSGGTRNNQLGAGSYLFLNLIEKWFSKYPNGEFLMGDCPRPSAKPTHDNGNLLYRRKLRVRSINGVAFRLKPKHSASDAPSDTQKASADERTLGNKPGGRIIAHEIPTPSPDQGNVHPRRAKGISSSGPMPGPISGEPGKA